MKAAPITLSPTSSARELFRAVLLAERPAFVAAAVASLLANLIALASSLYSMQVYDRVIPTQGLSTLTVLTIGALAACVFELVIKMTRARILEITTRQMDGVLSHGIFARLLAVRVDQLPPGIGSVSAQVRSYESIRAFASTVTMYAAVDAPFGILFLGVMWMLAGIELVSVPAVFFVVALVVGTLFRGRIAAHAASASAAGNRKAGVLVEAITNAEGIKAAGTQARRLAQWDALSKQSLDDELAIKHCSESASYFAAFVQQASYVVMIGVGAYIAATSTALTTGGLIACSILSGRVLAPIAMLPGMIVQWAHAKIALANLERIFALEQDNHGIERPIEPSHLHGALRVENLSFAYPGRPPMAIAKLDIGAGEKVAILGPIGAGKSTLLKLLAGLYKPSAGRVLIDDLELQQIARASIVAQVGYLAQDLHLAAGTLRDNLVCETSPEHSRHDDVVLAACRATGLSALVASHPKGLDLEIGEGGTGVSGGQRRLVGLTRLLLSQPSLWLLDEPTSAMDEAAERATLALLQRTIRPEHTLVLVTHKPQLLALVDRIVVLTDTGIALDGPRQAVLQMLQQKQPQGVAGPSLRPVETSPAPDHALRAVA